MTVRFPFTTTLGGGAAITHSASLAAQEDPIALSSILHGQPTAPMAWPRSPTALSSGILRSSSEGRLVVELPDDPLQLIGEARRSGASPVFLERLDRLFQKTLAEELADSTGQGRSQRYRRVDGALSAFVDGQPEAERDRIRSAHAIARHYVEGGEPAALATPLGATTAPPFYRRLNSTLHGVSSFQELERVAPDLYDYYVRQLVPAVKSLPGEVHGVVFRGTTLPSTLIDDFIQRRCLEYGQLAPMSTSVSLADAVGFLRPYLHLAARPSAQGRGREATLMVIQSRTGKLISIGSAFAREEEVLLLHPSRFEVLTAFRAAPPKADGEPPIAYVFLREKPQPDLG